MEVHNSDVRYSGKSGTIREAGFWPVVVRFQPAPRSTLTHLGAAARLGNALLLGSSEEEKKLCIALCAQCAPGSNIQGEPSAKVSPFAWSGCRKVKLTTRGVGHWLSPTSLQSTQTCCGTGSLHNKLTTCCRPFAEVAWRTSRLSGCVSRKPTVPRRCLFETTSSTRVNGVFVVFAEHFMARPKVSDSLRSLLCLWLFILLSPTQNKNFLALRLSHSWTLCPLSSQSTAHRFGSGDFKNSELLRRRTFITAGQQNALALPMGPPGHSRNLSFAFRVSTTCAWHRRIHVRLFHFVQDLTYKNQARSVRQQLTFPSVPLSLPSFSSLHHGITTWSLPKYVFLRSLLIARRRLTPTS